MQLRIRRAKSVALPSQGYLQGLLAALQNISGVTFAAVYENNTDATDGDGIPSHSIWVIVRMEDPATDAQVAQAIYIKRNAGCGMFGDHVVNVTQVDNTQFPIRWDFAEYTALFARFTWNSIDGINPANITKIINDLATSYKPGVYEEVDIGTLNTKVQASDPNTFITSAGFGLLPVGPFFNKLLPATKANQFTSPTLIVLPMILSPFNPVTGTHLEVVTLATQQFTALGGRSPYSYSFVTNNSGGSINPTSGLYTAGASGFTDTIRVTDSLSNTADATIDVL